MAINFNKLFLQNLLPNRHPSANTATHDACDNGSVSDYDNDYTERAHANSSFFLDNQNDKLTQALEALRRIITTHKVHQQRHGRRQVLKPQTTSSTVEGVHSGPLRGSSSNRDQAVVVEVRVVFLKIGEIDTLKETFRADAFIQARWPEPRLNEKSEEVG
ncbi:hypothetical protein AAHC03_04961 [Spirometra sp. Aus1]